MAKTETIAAAQQQLALEEKSPRAMPLTYASYDWTSEGLAERSGGDAIVYSYWDQPFGCQIRRQHQEPKVLLPDWPVFDAPDYGRSADARSVLAHHPRSLGTGIAAGPGADRSLQDYLATLPRLLVRLATPFGANQWLVLDLFRKNPDLWRKVHQQTALGRLGTLSLLLELFSAAGRTRPNQRAEFAAFLTTTCRETALRRYLGRCPDPAVLAMLEQMPPGAGMLGHRSIKSVLALGTNPKTQKELLRYKAEANSAILAATGWEAMADMRRLLESGLPLARLLQIMRSGLRNLTASERPAALAALKKIGAPQSLQWWSSQWTTLSRRSRSFPEPPLPPTDKLTALATPAALEAENRRLEFDLTRYLDDVLAGDLYFYRLEGDPAAVLCLAATDSGDWILLDALDPSGSRPDAAVMDEIAASMLAAGKIQVTQADPTPVGPEPR